MKWWTNYSDRKWQNFKKKLRNYVKPLTITLLTFTNELDIYNWGEDISYYSKLTSRMSVFYNRYGIRLTKDKYQQSFNFKFEFVFINQVLK